LRCRLATVFLATGLLRFFGGDCLFGRSGFFGCRFSDGLFGYGLGCRFFGGELPFWPEPLFWLPVKRLPSWATGWLPVFWRRLPFGPERLFWLPVSDGLFGYGLGDCLLTTGLAAGLAAAFLATGLAADFLTVAI